MRYACCQCCQPATGGQGLFYPIKDFPYLSALLGWRSTRPFGLLLFGGLRAATRTFHSLFKMLFTGRKEEEEDTQAQERWRIPFPYLSL